MAETKMTKKMWYEELMNIVDAADAENKDEMKDFLTREIEQLEARAEKAAERAAKKKAEGDELRSAVEAVLTDEFQTIDEIFAQVEGEDLTKAKVTARLTQLVKSGIATKDAVKTEDNRKVMAYKKAGFEDDNTEE